MKQRVKKASGFGKYLHRTLATDERARALFFAEMMEAPLASQLRLFRHFHGLSQMAVAKRTGLLQPEIARLERAGSNPRADTLEKMAKGLGARVELVPEQLLAHLAAQQVRSQGEAYFIKVTTAAR